MQLILEPGFSTAGSVTQQAGRGVGMDVVATEIKRLGGSLNMETRSGQGTTFTVRLPFTLAISHALVVRTGDEYYALPLPTVEGVLRLSKTDVTTHLGRETATFEQGGQKYRFQHLAAFVGLEPSPLPEGDVTVPVVLVRAGEHSTGLVADELIGSREIVVKSVGTADLQHPRHLRRHHPGRRPHRHHPGYRRAGARRVARALGRAAGAREGRPAHLRHGRR